MATSSRYSGIGVRPVGKPEDERRLDRHRASDVARESRVRLDRRCEKMRTRIESRASLSSFGLPQRAIGAARSS